METAITYRLIVGSQILHESLDRNSLFEIQQNLPDFQKEKSKIVPIAGNGSEFLLG